MKRVLTGLVLVPVAFFVIVFGPWWLLTAVAAGFAVICFREYAALAGQHGIRNLGTIGYPAGLILMVSRGDVSLPLTGVALLGLVVALKEKDLADGFRKAAALSLGVLYIFGTWRCAILLRPDANPHWLLYAFLVSWVGDIAAYYVGRSIGAHKMAPRISPAKSWEGAAASMLMTALFGWFYLDRFLPGLGSVRALALSAMANAAAQVGDLAESALKRGAGVKDSGTLLPGHGGMLDRVDSTLFTMPVVYAFKIWLA